MATLKKQRTILTPLAPVYENCAVGGGDLAFNNGYTFLHVKNAHTGAWGITVNSKFPCDYGGDHDVVVSIPAGEERMIGPFDRGQFNNADGKIEITYDGVTALTIAAITCGSVKEAIEAGLIWSDLGQQFLQTDILSLASLGGGIALAGTAGGGKILKSMRYSK